MAPDPLLLVTLFTFIVYLAFDVYEPYIHTDRILDISSVERDQFKLFFWLLFITSMFLHDRINEYLNKAIFCS